MAKEGPEISEKDNVPASKESSVSEDESRFEKPRVILTWQAPSREFDNKSPVYFISLVVFTLLVAVVFFFLGGITLSLAAIATGFVLFTLNRFEPATRQYQLLNVGIKVGDREYRWSKFVYFYIEESEPWSVLSLRTTMSFPDKIQILFPPELKEAIEERLLRHVEYLEHGERDVTGFLDKVIEELPLNLQAPFPRAVRKLFSSLGSHFSFSTGSPESPSDTEETTD